MADHTESILTERELAERWGVSERTLQNRRGLKTGPPWFRPLGSSNGPVRYRLADIEKWELQRMTGGEGDGD